MMTHAVISELTWNPYIHIVAIVLLSANEVATHIL
jgi:hypothetical protein